MDKLHFRQFGEGRPVLILHGGKLDHRHMVDPLEPVFAALDGWRRVYVDLPGCGGSSGFSHVQSQDDVLAEVAAFADAQGNGESWAVIGESRGSYIAQGLGYRFPDRVAGLCLVVPGGYPGGDPSRLPKARPIISAPHLTEDLGPALRARADRLVVQNAEILEKIANLKLPAANLHDADLEARVQRRFLFSFHDAMLTGSFDKPSLILSGRQDSISGFADTMDMLPCYRRATFGLLDCAGHSLSWERPEIVTAMIHDWLTRLEQS